MFSGAPCSFGLSLEGRFPIARRERRFLVASGSGGGRVLAREARRGDYRPPPVPPPRRQDAAAPGRRQGCRRSGGFLRGWGGIFDRRGDFQSPTGGAVSSRPVFLRRKRGFQPPRLPHSPTNRSRRERRVSRADWEGRLSRRPYSSPRGAISSRLGFRGGVRDLVREVRRGDYRPPPVPPLRRQECRRSRRERRVSRADWEGRLSRRPYSSPGGAISNRPAGEAISSRLGFRGGT